jgi:hypothetical protein
MFLVALATPELPLFSRRWRDEATFGLVPGVETPG